MSTLDDQLDKPMRELLARYRFDAATFERLRLRLQSGQAEPADNRVREPLGVPEPDDIIRLPAYGSAARAGLRALGLAALGRGEVAACILAGGMATRFGGVVKAGVEVVSGHSFLELKLRDVEQLAEQLQRPVSAVLMTSFATDAEIQRMVSSRQDSAVQVTCFAQSISLRLSADGQLFRDQAGRPSPYAPGHGDMTFALAEAGLLARLQRQGVRYLYVSNVDNLAASLDPSVIGAHLEGEARMTFEVAPLWPGDQGGVPARLAGRLQVIEALRYPAGFVESSIPWFSINSFVLDIAGLEPELPLEWFRVSKQVDGRAAVQFERFVNQLTAFVPSRALAIEREGLDCRFLPVKDPNDLRARLPLIRTLLESRRTL